MLGNKRHVRIYSTVIFQDKADLDMEDSPPSDPLVVINKATET